MKLHIEITDEKVKKGIKGISLKQRWSLNKLGQAAIEFYLRARKVIK